MNRSTSRLLLLLTQGMVILHLFLSLPLTNQVNRWFRHPELVGEKGGDFFTVYAAAKNAWRGEPVYESDDLSTGVPYLYQYRYFPVTAYLAGPLALLPPERAYWLWVLVLEIILLVQWRVTLRACRSADEFIAVTLFWLFFSPWISELHMGQFSFVTASLVFWFLWHHRENRRRAGGFFWTVSTFVKGYSIFFIPVLWRENYRKFIAIALGGLILSSAVYFTRFPGDLTAFLANFSPESQPSFGNLGLQAAVTHIVTHSGLHSRLLLSIIILDRPVELSLLFPVVFVVFVGLSLWLTTGGGRRAVPHHLLEGVLLWTCTFFLVYRHIWEYHFLFLQPLLIFLYLESRTRREKVILLAAYAFLAIPQPFQLLAGISPGTSNLPLEILHHWWRLTGVIILYIYGVLKFRSRNSPQVCDQR